MRARIVAVEQDGSRIIAVAQTPTGGKIRQPISLDEIKKICHINVRDFFDAMKYLPVIRKSYVNREVDLSGMFGGGRVKFG